MTTKKDIENALMRGADTLWQDFSPPIRQSSATVTIT